jgi:hypothetical protein
MCADATFMQIAYLDQYIRLFGLETTAIIFSLPWAMLMWSYVVSVSRTLSLPINRISPSPDRMITFSVALLCFSLVVSNPWTRIIVGVTSGLVATLTVLSLRIAWGSGSAWSVWVDGLLPSLIGPLQRVRGGVERLILFVLGVIESLCNRLASCGRGGAGDV